MRTQVKMLVIAMLISAPFFLHAEKPVDKSNPEYNAIFRTLNYYFHGVNMYDVNALKKAYHPDANFSFIDNETGALEQFSASQYFTLIGEAEHVVHQRSLHLKSIDVTGKAALVRTEIIYDKKGQRINDYLSLLKIDGEWKIVNRTSYKDYASFGKRNDKHGDQERERKGIDKVVWTYLAGAHDHDLNAFESALHPAAEVAFVNERSGLLQAISRPEYMTLHAGLTDEQLGLRQEILSLDRVGDMATAKVHTFYKRYKAATTDYLVLMKTEGQWQIVHKITHKDKKAFLAPA